MAAPVPAPPAKASESPLRRSDYPALHRSASQASKQGHGWYRRLILAYLGLLATTEILGAVSFLVSDSDDSTENAFKALIVLVVLGTMAVNFATWRRADDKNWFDGRAVAESVKTTSWRYMMRTEPFEDDATCDYQFARRLRAILGERPRLRQELDALSIEPHQITDRMREVRGLGVTGRRDFYVRARLDDQIQWYFQQAQRSGQLADRWYWGSFGAEFVALVIAVSTFVIPEDSWFDLEMNALNLVGVAAFVATAFTAWTQLGRYSELNKSYGMAWQELLGIKDLAGSVRTDPELQDLVRSGEDAISREHTMWIAKRDDALPERVMGGIT